MTTQPEALWLAQELRRTGGLMVQAEAEMRRLYDEADELKVQRDALLEALTAVYEVWAGSEGIPEPQTACEAYLLKLIEQMRDLAKEGMK